MERNNNGSAGWTMGSAQPAKKPTPLPQTTPAPMPTPTPMPHPMPKPPVIKPPAVELPIGRPPVIQPPVAEPPVVQPPAVPCDDMVLVMSYVRMQEWDQTYEAETGLSRGTIFPELDLPFVGEGACRND